MEKVLPEASQPVQSTSSALVGITVVSEELLSVGPHTPQTSDVEMLVVEESQEPQASVGPGGKRLVVVAPEVVWLPRL